MPKHTLTEPPGWLKDLLHGLLSQPDHVQHTGSCELAL